jgi:hypothetical protein
MILVEFIEDLCAMKSNLGQIPNQPIQRSKAIEHTTYSIDTPCADMDTPPPIVRYV